MAKRVLAWFGLLAACASFGGCGKTGDGTGAVELSDLPAALANLLCGSLGGCCKASSFAFEEAECRRVQTANFDDELTGLDPAKVHYDAEAASDCLAALRSNIQCGRVNDSSANAACNRVFTGTVGPGQACTDSMECARPAGGSVYCEPAAEGSTAEVCTPSAGSAAVHGKAGQACNGSCEDDSCSIGVATGPGDTATPVALAVCYQNEGLYCGPTGTCEALLGLGQNCSDFSACTTDLFCDFSTSVCTAPRELGAPCQGSDECKSGYCDGDNAACAERAVTATTCSVGKVTD